MDVGVIGRGADEMKRRMARSQVMPGDIVKKPMPQSSASHLDMIGFIDQVGMVEMCAAEEGEAQNR